MNDYTTKNRLFIGMDVIAPWPETLPEGRILKESERHFTLAFLGNAELSKTIEILKNFPVPGFRVGIGAIFDEPIFLPIRFPQTAGWHIQLLEQEGPFNDFQKRLLDFLEKNDFHIRKHENESFNRHITLARRPFAMSEWMRHFVPRPLFLKNIHLYESVGNLHYESRWTYEILPPFESIEHTADMAFLIRGETMEQLLIHASLALAFEHLPFIRYFAFQKPIQFEDLVLQLNQLIARLDAEEGCPYKAVSFHGEVTRKNDYLEWEMIVDV